MLATTYPLPSAKVRPGFIKDFADALTKAGCIVRLILPHHMAVAKDYAAPDPYLAWFRYAPASWERIAYGDGIMANIRRRPWLYLLLPAFLVAMTVRTMRELRSGRWDVIHAHWWFPCGLAASVAKKFSRSEAPLVITCHGGDFYALSGRYWDVIKKIVLRSAQNVIAVSNSMRCDILALGLDHNHCKLGPMGVDLLKKFVPPKSGQPFRWDLLFVGRFAEKKGICVLLDALSILDDSGRKLRVCIVGDGPLANVVESRVGSYQHCKVDLVGSVANDDLPLIYQESRAFIFPSLKATDGDQEGLGLVVIEAIGCGCLVLASDLAVLEDVFGEMYSCLLFPPGSARLLAEKIVLCLGESEECPVDKDSLRRQVMSRFCWSKVTDNYLSIYRALLEGE